MAVPTLTDAASLGDGRWYRLHPLTPVLQGGLVIVGAIGFVLAALWETVVVRVLVTAFGSGVTETDETEDIVRLFDALVSFGGFLVVAGVVGVLVIWLQWRLHMVRMDDDVIEIKKGVIFRTSRRARRDRVNTVGVRRPLIPRLLGLAKLDIQAAGNDANVVLAYLPHRTAEGVRQEILEPSRGEDVLEPPAANSATRVVEVPLFRYLASLVLSVESVVFVIAVAVTVTGALRAGEVVAWLGVVIVLFVYVAFLADRFFRVGSFVVDTVDSDLRVSLGLLSTSVETIPPNRIHALQLSQPWPWKLVGWWRIDANLASSPGAQVSKAPAHTVIVPVATMGEALRIVDLCMPGISQEHHADVITSALMLRHSDWVAGQPAITHAIGSPRRAAYRIPLSFRVNGGALVGDTVLLRTGQWIKKLALVSLARVQSSGVSVGPWHDALGLSLFSLHSVSGPVETRVPALDRTEVERWWEILNDATCQAIALSRPRKPRTRKVAS